MRRTGEASRAIEKLLQTMLTYPQVTVEYERPYLSMTQNVHQLIQLFQYFWTAVSTTGGDYARISTSVYNVDRVLGLCFS
jgi:hypothetical protein